MDIVVKFLLVWGLGPSEGEKNMNKAFIILLSVLLVFMAISCNSTNVAYADADDGSISSNADGSADLKDTENEQSSSEDGFGTVIFNPNSASGSMPDQQIPEGVLTKLDKCTLTMVDCHFAGWNTDSAAEGDWLDDEAEIMLSAGEQMTLYAFFEPDTATVTFYANGGSGDMHAQNVIINQGFVLNSNSFTAPVNTAFYGWNTKTDGSGDFYGDCAYITIKENLSLYAMWTPAN